MVLIGTAIKKMALAGISCQPQLLIDQNTIIYALFIHLAKHLDIMFIPVYITIPLNIY